MSWSSLRRVIEERAGKNLPIPEHPLGGWGGVFDAPVFAGRVLRGVEDSAPATHRASGRYSERVPELTFLSMARPMIWPFRSKPKPKPKPEPAPPLDAAAIVRRARRLRFRVRPGAVSALAGAYLGARPGVGLTFAELRAYEPGDDVRHIDWNVTARQGRPFVRRYVEER